jgi:hypothetical protein
MTTRAGRIRVWREGVVLRPGNRGQGRRKNQITVLKSDLPKADPGDVVAHRSPPPSFASELAKSEFRRVRSLRRLRRGDNT